MVMVGSVRGGVEREGSLRLQVELGRRRAKPRAEM